MGREGSDALDLRCVACHTMLAAASLAGCPRCGADNRAWDAWLGAGRRAHLKRFFLGSPWGRLALFSLLLPLVGWAAPGIRPVTTETAVLALSLVLNAEGLLFLFIQRDALWIDELTRRAASRFRPGLLAIGGAGYLIFIGVGIVVLRDWVSGLLEVGLTGYADPWGEGMVVLLALAFAGQALGAGLYAVYAYGRWRSRTFPMPVFLDETRLLDLTMRSVKPRIQMKTGDTYEVVTAHVVSLRRTDRAGLDLKIRAEAGTDTAWEGCSLRAVQGWRAISDKWGRVLGLEQEGPLEYVPEPGPAPPSPGAKANGQILEGEIIFSGL